jgi:SH3 domain-containing YSC84-like protein 1
MPSRFRRNRENVAMMSCPPAIFARTVPTRIAAPWLATIKRAATTLAATGFAALVLAACANGPGGEQTLVDRATLTVQEMMTQNVSQDPKSLLRHAKGVMICPRVFKAGFFFGGEGGSCVMLARSGNGTWSYPTFYDIGSGSFGFQFGVQDSQLLLLIMTNRGLNAVMDSQVRLGAGASVAVASVGGGVQGATTAAVGADIVAFAAARGLFGGVSLEGGVMSARIDENQSYYGQPFAARQIVLQMQGTNRGADSLREILTRYGGTEEFYPGRPGGTSGGTYQPPPGQSSYQPSQAPTPNQPSPLYQSPPAQQTYPAGNQPSPGQQASPSLPPPPPAPRVASPGNAPPPSGYQPPPGQYTYPPSSGTGPIQEQSLPPPGR